jgi:hypothetical protein
LEGLAMENLGLFYDHLVYFITIWSILWPFGLFYDHLVYFMTIWSILWPFGLFYDNLIYFMTIGSILWPLGIFCGHLVYFSQFWYFVPRIIWQPCFQGSRLGNSFPRVST